MDDINCWHECVHNNENATIGYSTIVDGQDLRFSSVKSTLFFPPLNRYSLLFFKIVLDQSPSLDKLCTFIGKVASK